MNRKASKVSLPDLLEAISKGENVEVIPNTARPVNIFDFMEEMKELMEKLQLRDHYRGCGHTTNFELSFKEGKNPFEDISYHKYWVHFDCELYANKFLLLMSEGQYPKYAAQVPSGPLGLLGLKFIERID